MPLKIWKTEKQGKISCGWKKSTRGRNQIGPGGEINPGIKSTRDEINLKNDICPF